MTLAQERALGWYAVETPRGKLMLPWPGFNAVLRRELLSSAVAAGLLTASQAECMGRSIVECYPSEVP